MACGNDAVVDLACVVAGFFATSSLYDTMLTSVLYWQRHRLWGLLPEFTRVRLLSWRRQYVPLEVFDWHSATRAGLSSTLFDIEANIRDGDARAGLDEAASHHGATRHRTFHALMRQSFDEARLQRHHQLLQQNRIDPQTGIPLDAKAITRL